MNLSNMQKPASVKTSGPRAATGGRACFTLQWLRAYGYSFLTLACISARAADTNEFMARIYTNGAGKTLLYRLLLPKDYDASRPYPLIVYLHGAAARGNDNAKPLD